MTVPGPDDYGDTGDQSEDDSTKPGGAGSGGDGGGGSAGGGRYHGATAMRATSAASDWLVATRHGRDDATNRANR